MLDTRLLYASAVVIATIAGGYYYYSGKAKKLDVESAKNMTYTAKDVYLTQTDERGQLYVRAQVKQLEQDMQKKTSRLNDVNAEMYKQGQVDATFSAKQANGFDDNNKIVLTGNVIASKYSEQGALQFFTEELTGYPKSRKIETEHPVEIESPQGQFTSQGLKADLNEGQYEFFHIRGKYVPNS